MGPKNLSAIVWSDSLPALCDSFAPLPASPDVTLIYLYLTLQRPVISQCGRVLGLELGQLIDCDPFN